MTKKQNMQVAGVLVYCFFNFTVCEWIDSVNTALRNDQTLSGSESTSLRNIEKVLHVINYKLLKLS